MVRNPLSVLPEVPPALLLLALSPALDGGDEAPVWAAFTCWLMKMVITSAYCGAGVSKLVAAKLRTPRRVDGIAGWRNWNYRRV